MPIYEYRCEKCGNTIEVIQKFSDEPLSEHENCGGRLTKLISAAGFQFKGTGWYVTDYARKPQGGGPESKKDGQTSSDGKGDGGAEKPKPATGTTTGKTENSSSGS